MLGTYRSPNLVTSNNPVGAAPIIAARLQQRITVARQGHGRTCSLACQQRRLPRGVVIRSSSAEAVQVSPGADAGPSSVPKAEEWELDFCSRPILDERGKKLWELIICDPDRTFEHTQYFPNNKINSTQVCIAGLTTGKMHTVLYAAQDCPDCLVGAAGCHQA